jgi:phytoene synthase
LTPQQYCQERIGGRGSAVYYSLLFLDSAERDGAAALLAYREEVLGVLTEVTDRGVARAKLDWWRTELDRAFAGKPQHPVTRALAPALGRWHLAHEQLLEVVEGVDGDLDHGEYPTFNDLALYCHRVSGVVWQMLAEVFGYEDRRTLRYAQSLGTGLQLAEVVGRVREDARRGHIYLPADEMGDFQVSRQALHAPETSVALRALLTAQARRSREYLRRALEQLPGQDRYRQRAGLILAAIYQATLDETERDGFRVLERRVALTPLRKLWIAARTGWQEQRREARRRRDVRET